MQAGRGGIQAKPRQCLDLRRHWVNNDSRTRFTNRTRLPSNIMNEPTHEPMRPNEAPVTSVEGASNGKRRASDRLNIPSSIVRGSGFVPGDKAFVVDEDPAGAVPKPCLVLLKQQPAKLLADYVVAKDRRIRVTPAILKKCGLAGENFEIDGGEGKIVVRLRKE
jgi:hypothetical protein